MDVVSLQSPVRVLHLEDDPNDPVLVAELLRTGGLQCDFVTARTEAEFTDALRRARFDLIISDYTLPHYDGLAALSRARELQPDTPFIFFSGTIGEEAAVEMLQHGAADYVVKQRPQRLVAAIRRALASAAERADLRRAEARIREQAELLNQTHDAIILCELDSAEPRILFWSRGAERIYGWRAEEVMGKSLPQVLFQGNPPSRVREAAKILNERGEWMGELREFTKDGRQVVVQGRSTVIRDGAGRPQSLLIINTDITERKFLEEKFLRAQRLESLGVLISGIAHDLNNILVPLLIGVQLLREQKASSESEPILNTMEDSVRRGSEMLKQVLTFARGGETNKTVVRPDQLVREVGKIIANTFPKSIQCRVQADETVAVVSGVPAQLHQVLMNLCVNARDAMPEGGVLTLAVYTAPLDPADVAARPGVAPGDYVCFTVADTGTGIPAGQLDKIFEPFFTTKPPGKGTGLGLSTSLGIVKKHGGFMTVRSEAGRGTEFKCFLPAVGAGVKTTREPLLPPTGAGECVLVVDDEQGIVAIVRAALESYGYRVVTAGGGAEALTRFAEHPDALHLVIVDLDMPFMNGWELIAALRELRPGIRVLIAGGSIGEAEEAASRAQHTTFIAKPFTNQELLEAVHRALGGSRDASV
ncbi:MAG: response regulator [Verrucomicrobiota bacterium]|nr:response regulator [Verrucomicrobiota bacterium]